MVSRIFCILVFWMKVALALERLMKHLKKSPSGSLAPSTEISFLRHKSREIMNQNVCYKFYKINYMYIQLKFIEKNLNKRKYYSFYLIPFLLHTQALTYSLETHQIHLFISTFGGHVPVVFIILFWYLLKEYYYILFYPIKGVSLQVQGDGNEISDIINENELWSLVTISFLCFLLL